MFKNFTVLIVSLALFAVIPTHMMAAPLKLTVSAKAAFDKTLSAANPALRASLSSQYNSFLSLQEQDQTWDARIKTAHYTNAQTLIALRKQIRQINAGQIIQLENKLKQTKAMYSPIFSLYSSFNTLFGSPLTSTKVAVQFARLDIKAKRDALDNLKASTAKKVKSIRNLLAESNPIPIQIKSVRSAIIIPKNRITAGWDRLKMALKSKQPAQASASLAILVDNMNKILNYKQKIYDLELNIRDIQLKAKAQIPD